MGLSVFLLACEAGADLAQPTLLAHLVNEGVLGADASALARWGGAMLAFVVIGALCALGRNALSAAVSQQFGAALRERTFDRVLALGWARTRAWETASLQNRLTFDVTQVQNLVNGLMRLYLKAPLLGAGALVLAFLSDPWLAVFILPIFPVVVGLFVGQMRSTLPLYQGVQQRLDDLNARVRDFLHGIRIIKGFGRQQDERDRFAAVNDGHAEATARVQTLQALFSPAVTLTVALTVVGILAVGGALPGAGRVGHLMAFVQYLTQISFSLIVVSNLVGVVSRARTSVGRIAEVLQAPLPAPSHEAPLNPPSGLAPGALVCEDLEFGWGGTPVLSGVNLRLKPGDRLGVLGSTGSGKSTLLYLFAGLLEPRSGRLEVADARRALVTQRPLLVTGSVRSNLLWGDPRADDAVLERALETADAWGFVRDLPGGFDAELGPGGVTLSGGQRQRLTLARALVRRPHLLLLDEAFSALDQDTEDRIEARLREHHPSTTVVLVAQKATSVRHCSTVLVLDEGRVEACGTLDEVARSAVYQQICLSQGVRP